MNRLLFFLFAVLASFKFFSVLWEKGGISPDLIFSALIYTGMFGSPQLFWVYQCRKTFGNYSQLIAALVALVGLTALSTYFGSFPGSQRPSWGGEAHFDVPVALLVEWFFALFAWGLSRKAKGRDGVDRAG